MLQREKLSVISAMSEFIPKSVQRFLFSNPVIKHFNLRTKKLVVNATGIICLVWRLGNHRYLYPGLFRTQPVSINGIGSFNSRFPLSAGQLDLYHIVINRKFKSILHWIVPIDSNLCTTFMFFCFITHLLFLCSDHKDWWLIQARKHDSRYIYYKYTERTYFLWTSHCEDCS